MYDNEISNLLIKVARNYKPKPNIGVIKNLWQRSSNRQEVFLVSERLMNQARARLITSLLTLSAKEIDMFITILISKYKCLVCIIKTNTWRKFRIDIGNEEHNKQFFYTATRIQRCTNKISVYIFWMCPVEFYW